MRILGFSKVDWRNYETHQDSKMLQPEFTTWRWPRKDRDWAVGEVVSVVVRTRSPHRLILGEAEISANESVDIYRITDIDARTDGFPKAGDLQHYLMMERITRGLGLVIPNRLTLRWLSWFPPMILYGTKGWQAEREYPSLFGHFKPVKTGD